MSNSRLRSSKLNSKPAVRSGVSLARGPCQLLNRVGRASKATLARILGVLNKMNIPLIRNINKLQIYSHKL